MSLAVSAQAQDDFRACRNLSHCLDIVKEHGPDEFDYAVLASDFHRFGPKGTDRLIKLLADEKSAENAVDFLNFARPELSETQAAQLIQNWPQSGGQARLVDLIATVISPVTIPVFRQALLSGEIKTTKTAFFALEQRDNAGAVRLLQDAVFSLKDDQMNQAVALSDVITMLDKKYGGETYKKYAFGLAQDDRINPMANVVGLKSALSIEGLDVSPLSGSNIVMNAFERSILLGKAQNWEHFERLALANPGPWMNLGLKLKADNMALSNSPLLSVAVKTSPEQASRMIERFLKVDGSYKDLANAIIAAYQFDPDQYAARINQIASRHPVSHIRVLSHLFDGNTGRADRMIMDNISGLHPYFYKTLRPENNKARQCALEILDHAERVNEVPFFDWTKIPDRPQYMANKHILSAWPLIEGWLLGFNKGEWGGGLIFVSHDMKMQNWLLKDQNIIAIIPFTPPAGQLYAKQYWVVGQSSFAGDRNIYRLDLNSRDRSIRFVTHIPELASNFGREGGGKVLIAGYGDARDAHPPLRVSTNGTLTRACE